MGSGKGVVFLQGTAHSWYQPVLNSIKWALEELGYEVRWWRARSEIQRNVTALIWWGCNVNVCNIWKARNAGVQTIWLERGWTIDRDTCAQLDSRGTGGRASWVDEPFSFEPQGPLSVKDKGYLLVVLRYEAPDGKPVDFVHEVCPFFKTNVSWARFLLHNRNHSLPIRFRPHPVTSYKRNDPIRKLAESVGAEWDTNDSFLKSLEGARAVAVQDSTAGVWAMERGVPVLCYGRQVYRHEGACCCLCSDPVKTRSVFEGLARGWCSQDRGAVQEMVAKIRARQWYPTDRETFPSRLQKEFNL